MTPYILVEAKTKDDLARFVNEAWRNGYRPCGGVTYIDNSRHGYGCTDQWVQPMCLLDGR